MTAAQGSSLISGAINARDVGGLAAARARTRRGVLLRSGSLARLDDAGREQLRAFGLRRIIDLRADDEVTREPSALGDLQVTTRRAPLFLGSSESFFAEDLSLSTLYRRLVDESAPLIVDVVRDITQGHPVLVHCTAGKDRTGVTVALTLAAAGVDEDAIIADYARTESALPPRRTAAVLAFAKQNYPDARNLAQLVGGSPAEAMAELLADLRARYGAPVEYLRAHGLGDDEIAELGRVLIEK